MAVEESKAITSQIMAIQYGLRDARDGIAREPIGSALYNKYKSAVKKGDAEVATLNVKLKKAKQSEKDNAKAAKDKSTTEKNAYTLQNAQDQRQRIVDAGGNTAVIDNKVKDLTSKSKASGLTVSGLHPIDNTKVTSKPVSTSAPKSESNKTTTSKVDTKVPPEKKPPKTPEQFMAEYGVQLALINSDPSLKALFAKAVDNKFDGPRFKAEILNTTWAKTHSAEWQANQRTMLESPATYAASYNRMREKIAMLAVKDGLVITPEQVGAEVTQKADGTWDIKTGADDSLARWVLDQYGAAGLSDDLITKHLAELGKINLALPGGVAGGAITELKTYAGQMGMGNLTLPPTGNNAVGSDYFSAAANSILLGKSTKETWQADILAKSKDIFKAFASSIDAGQSVQNIAAPYINTLANMLEIPTSQVDIGASTGYGKMVRDALMGSDPANQKPMALYDFERLVKSRPEWGKTNNARDTVMGGVNDLLKSFGKVG